MTTATTTITHDLDNGITLERQVDSVGQRFEADGYLVSRSVYESLLTGTAWWSNVRREFTLHGHEHYADSYPVSQKIYDVLVSLPRATQPDKSYRAGLNECNGAFVGKLEGCCGYKLHDWSLDLTAPEEKVTLTGVITDVKVEPVPKPKTRGEEVAEDFVRPRRRNEVNIDGYWLESVSGADRDGIIKRVREDLAKIIDREIAAAEKRGEDRIKAGIAAAKKAIILRRRRYPGYDHWSSGYRTGLLDADSELSEICQTSSTPSSKS